MTLSSSASPNEKWTWGNIGLLRRLIISRRIRSGTPNLVATHLFVFVPVPDSPSMRIFAYLIWLEITNCHSRTVKALLETREHEVENFPGMVRNFRRLYDQVLCPLLPVIPKGHLADLFRLLSSILLSSG